jgi:hypothetical protein
MPSFKFALALVAACGVLSSVAASAFTYDSRTNQDPTGLAKFRDSLSNGGKIGNSHFSVQFSGGNSGDGQSGADSRFVPSSNPAFANPYYSPNNLDMALGNHH